MANEKIMAIKAKSIGYAAVGTATPSTYTKINGVISGMAISQDATTLTAVEHEFSDNPLKQIPTSGAYKVTFDVGEFSFEDVVALQGGTWDASTGLYKLPMSAAIIEKEWQIEFYEGLTSIIIHKGQVSTNWDGADLKTAPLKLHVEITALTDGTDFVDMKVPAVS